jgi:hypothetical protein
MSAANSSFLGLLGTPLGPRGCIGAILISRCARNNKPVPPGHAWCTPPCCIVFHIRAMRNA